MFIRTKTHDRFIAMLEERYEAQITEMRRTLEMFAEQIEYLRLTAGRPQPVTPREPVPEMVGASPYLGEEEEDLQAMKENGLLSEKQLEDALQELAFMSHSIEQAPSY